MGRYRLGIDIGGTFTDFALQSSDTGELAVWKHLSTPSDPSIAAVEGAAELLEREGVTFAEVEQIVHGTTIGANIVVEGKGARTAVITTEGFGDMLLIQRQLRHNPYDIVFNKHESLVPRHLVFEIGERVLYDGAVDRPLRDDEVRTIARRMAELQVESVAVSLIHSYANPAHERRIEEILLEELPGVTVSISSEVAPVMREYERTSTTVVNAYIRRAFETYLQSMAASLRSRGFAGGFYLMQANGGVTTAEVTAQLPVRALESGPAGGVTMAAAHGRRLGAGDLLAFDMGGTTAKACLVEDGEPRMVNLFEVDRTLMRPNTGLPVVIRSIDLIEIGAGGGSLANEALGILRVGPQSAGADPGPVCYGLGGEHPTVTDANLVLGYLNPKYFNGGRMDLDLPAARAALERLGEELGLSGERAAWGIHEAVTTNMHQAMRAVAVERTRDPRQLTLVASGGAGPIHAARLARQLGMRRLVLPVYSGVMSAIGLLHADPRFDLMRTWISRVDEGDQAAMQRIFGELEDQAGALLDATGLTGSRTLVRSVDMRYVGQGHVVEVTLPEDPQAGGAALTAAFGDRYATLYGYADDDAVAEIAAVRVSARTAAPSMAFPQGDGGGRAATSRETREVYFPETDGYVACPCYLRDDLDIGAELVGPAVIEENESSSVILPGDRVTVDPYRNLIVEIGAHPGV